MEAGIYVSWNYLYGFPGESRADFEGIIEIIPAISHLSPPEGFGPIRFDRYSPYHSDPESFGVDEVKPFRHYLDIFPFSRSHDEIAYHFSSAQPLGINADSDFLSFFGNRIQNWIDCWEREERPYLRLSKINSDYYLIEDTRSLANEQFSVVERTVADALSALRTPISVFDRDQMYNELIDRGWVVELDGLAVSVVMAA